MMRTVRSSRIVFNECIQSEAMIVDFKFSSTYLQHMQFSILCKAQNRSMAELQSLLGCKCCVLTQSAGLRERTTRSWSTCRNWKGFRFQFRWNRMIHLRNHNQLRVSGETVIDLHFTGESTKVNGNKNNSIKIDKENVVSRDPLVQRNWNRFHYET